MTRGDSQFDWRAVGALVALLVGLFTVTNFLTNDKIDSKVQQHEISTEQLHQKEITEIKEDIATLTATQQSILKTTDRLEKQNDQILKKLDNIRDN